MRVDVLCPESSAHFEQRGSVRTIIHYKTVWTPLIRNFASQKVWATLLSQNLYGMLLCFLGCTKAKAGWVILVRLLQFVTQVCCSVLNTLQKISHGDTGANKAFVSQESSHYQKMSCNIRCTSALCYPWKNTTTVPLHTQFLSVSQTEMKSLTGRVVSFGGCLRVEWSCR